MAIDMIYLGPCPPDETPVQVGEPGYSERAEAECRKYIALIRETLGPEPSGAQLKVLWQAHDLGSYCEVVVKYDDTSEEAREYAFRCDSDGPTDWDDAHLETKEEYDR